MKNFVNKSAFSLAEAMITLLIVSVALAAAAPIMSKKMVANNTSFAAKEVRQIVRNEIDVLFPAGSILLLNRNANSARNGCPEGWTNISEDLSGRFLKFDTVANVATNGDAFLPDHWHGIGAFTTEGNNDLAFYRHNFNFANGANQGYKFKQVDGDGTAKTFANIDNEKYVGYHRTMGAGTTSSLFPTESPVRAETVSNATNRFDGLQPASYSVIACRKN